jgi:hypothetical protein
MGLPESLPPEFDGGSSFVKSVPEEEEDME